MDRDLCMAKYPRLVAHMICQSLGYFTPKSAANAVSHYKANEPFACEWYSFMTDRRVGEGNGSHFYDHEGLLTTGRNVVSTAFHSRHSHKGYMAEYRKAIQLVRLSISDEYNPTFASWF